MHSIVSKDIPARKRWRERVFGNQKTGRRLSRHVPVRVTHIVEPDEQVTRLERKIAEYDGLIAELQAQFEPLQKKRALAARKLERRKRALSK